MSSSWSRFKQSTREVIRKAEKSETPQDITELSQNADRLQKVYSDVIDKSEYWIVPVKQRGSPSGRPLTALGSAWNLLADNYNEPDTVAFLRAAADTVIQLGEQKAELDIKNWTEYMEPKKEIVKSNIKEGHSALEKLKTRRLDLDSKKHKLTHSDADKVIHYQQSVTLAQERYDQTANQIRELLGPIADDGHVGAIQADQVGLVLNNLLEYSRRQTEMLEELNRKINFVERAENAHKRPALEISIASRFPSNSSSSELPDDNQSEHTSPTLRPSASQSSLPSLRPSGSHSSIPSLRPSASQNSIGSSQGSSLAANAPPSANAPVGQHPGMMNGAVPLPHLLGQPTPIGAAGRRGQPPPVTQRKPSLNTVLQQPVFKAMALYDFPAQEATDLSFQKDDVIVLKTWEGDWWEGTINGQSGTFPSNYVKRI